MDIIEQLTRQNEVKIRVYNLKISWSTCVLKSINHISQANESLAPSKRIDTSILFDAIRCLHGDTHFSVAQFKEYLMVMRKYEQFYETLNLCPIDFELEYFLLGVPFDCFIEGDTLYQLHEDYYKVGYYEVRTGEVKIEDFIAKAKLLIAKYMYETKR